MSSDYRVGIIGLGRIGFSLGFDSKREQPASHSMAFSQTKGASLAGGCDIDPVKRSEWQKAFPQAKTYAAAEDMLNDRAWDILIVAVNEHLHLSLLRQILPYKPRLIVMEKPVAPGYRSAAVMSRLCRRYSVPVCVNHERRFSRDYLYAKHLIESGRLGAPVTVNAFLLSSHKAVYPHDNRFGRGCLIHDGTHILDILCFILGEEIIAEKVVSSGKNRDGSINGITASGHAGTALLSFHVGYEATAFTFEIDIMFKKGRIRIGNGLFELYEAKPSPYYEGFKSLVQTEADESLYPTGYFAGMAQNCVDFLNGTCDLISPIDDGVGAMKAINRIIRRA